jgi:hypothetical protein
VGGEGRRGGGRVGLVDYGGRHHRCCGHREGGRGSGGGRGGREGGGMGEGCRGTRMDEWGGERRWREGGWRREGGGGGHVDVSCRGGGDGGRRRMLLLGEGGRSSGAMKRCDGREGADSVGEGGEAHRGEGGRGRGGGEEEATGSERGEHVDVHHHSLPSHSALVVRDGDVERGDERVTGDGERGVKGGERGVHVGGGRGEGRGGGVGGGWGGGWVMGLYSVRGDEVMRWYSSGVSKVRTKRRFRPPRRVDLAPSLPLISLLAEGGREAKVGHCSRECE